MDFLVLHIVLLKIMLERHVNQHFKSSNSKEDDGANGKLIRRKGKKLRLRKQPFTGWF